MDEKLRESYLKLLGLPVWHQCRPLPGWDDQGPVNVDAPEPGLFSAQETSGLQEEKPVPVSFSHEPVRSTFDSASEDERCAVASDGEESAAPAVKVGASLDELSIEVASCTHCELCQTRTQTVFGDGASAADWMIIGEAPGASEDQQGLPFVGRAGQLLTEMIRAMGMQRADVYIANILKCRPPQNRDPKPNEVSACEGYLVQQIKMIQPKIILAAGRVAAQNLLKTNSPLSQLRGKVHYYQDTPVVVVYHPAYLLRSLKEKRKAWADLQFAMKVFSDRQSSDMNQFYEN